MTTMCAKYSKGEKSARREILSFFFHRNRHFFSSKSSFFAIKSLSRLCRNATNFLSRTSSAHVHTHKKDDDDEEEEEEEEGF